MDVDVEQLLRVVRRMIRAAVPSRRWATVTATSPLTVVRKGEAAQVPVARCLVAGLQVGDLVLTELDGPELRVVGKNHTY